MNGSTTSPSSNTSKSTFDFPWEMSEWEDVLDYVPKEALDGDHVNGTDEIKLTHRMNKTEEEIERFTVDENLSEMDRCLFILKKGAEIQKQHVLQCIFSPGFTATHSAAGQMALLTALLDKMPAERGPFQAACGRKLAEFLSAIQVFPSSKADSMMSIIRKMMESKEKQVQEAWSDVMIAIVQFMSIEKMETEVLPEAVVNSGFAQPVAYRMWSCRVFGALAKRFPGAQIESKFLKKALSLCQDTDYEVRVQMCNQLNAIAESLGVESTKSVLMDEFVELLNDEELPVRKAALFNLLLLIADEQVKSSLPGFKRCQPAVHAKERPVDQEMIVSTIIPQLKKLCEERAGGLLPDLIENFGRFIWSIKDNISDNEITWFFQWFTRIANGNSDTKIKYHCAFNLPSLFYLLETRSNTTKGSSNSLKLKNVASDKNFALMLSVFDQLSKDPDKSICSQVAKCFGPIADTLGNDGYAQLRDIFIRLVMDEQESVFGPILSSLDKIIFNFAKASNWNKLDMECNEILFAISRRFRSLITPSKGTLRYRSLDTWILQLTEFQAYFDPEHIHTHLVPILLGLLRDTRSSLFTCDLSDALVHVLCTFSRSLPLQEYRERIVKAMKDQFKNNMRDNTYRHRLIFLDFCQKTMELFSAKYFKTTFMTEYLELAKDAVPNVRIRFALLLPLVRSLLRTPQDISILQKFNECLNTLVRTEKDHGVLAVCNEVCVTIAEIPSLTPSQLEEDNQKETEEAIQLEWEQEQENVRRKRELEELKMEFAKRQQDKGNRDRRQSAATMKDISMARKSSYQKIQNNTQLGSNGSLAKTKSSPSVVEHSPTTSSTHVAVTSTVTKTSVGVSGPSSRKENTSYTVSAAQDKSKSLSPQSSIGSTGEGTGRIRKGTATRGIGSPAIRSGLASSGLPSIQNTSLIGLPNEDNSARLRSKTLPTGTVEKLKKK